MQLSKKLVAVGVCTLMSLSLAACGGTSGSDSDASADGKITLKLAGWDVKNNPEFKALADAFHAKNPNIEVSITSYTPKEYGTLLLQDVSSGSGPNVYPVKNMRTYYALKKAGILTDVTDLAKPYADSKTVNMSSFKIDNNYFGMPYRMDTEVIYYNKDLFKKAGIPFPNGKWTWDDYAKLAKELTVKLKAAGSDAKGAYLQNWPITPAFAQAQTPGASYLNGNLGFVKKYYETVVDLQKSGAIVDFATIGSKQLKYQAMFGQQKAAMMPMGTWYIATLLQNHNSGQEKFEWGIAPVPQFDSSTYDKPVTYGLSTPMAMDPALTGAKAEAAKKFLAFCTSEEGAMALAKVGVFPANFTKDVAAEYFKNKGMPTDDLSKMALSKQIWKLEFPIVNNSKQITTIIGGMNTQIMQGSNSIDDAIKQAEDKLKAAGLVKK